MPGRTIGLDGRRATCIDRDGNTSPDRYIISRGYFRGGGGTAPTCAARPVGRARAAGWRAGCGAAGADSAGGVAPPAGTARGRAGDGAAARAAARLRAPPR